MAYTSPSGEVYTSENAFSTVHFNVSVAFQSNLLVTSCLHLS